jgi:hypothetical protein
MVPRCCVKMPDGCTGQGYGEPPQLGVLTTAAAPVCSNMPVRASHSPACLLRPHLQALRSPTYAYVSQLQLSHLHWAALAAVLPLLSALLQLTRLELDHLHDLASLLQLEALARALPGLKDLLLRSCPLADLRLTRPFAAARFRHLLSFNYELVLEPERKAARHMFAPLVAARKAAGRQAGQQAARQAMRAGAAAGGEGGTGTGRVQPAAAGGQVAAGQQQQQQQQEKWDAARDAAQQQLDGLLADVASVQQQLQAFEGVWEEVVAELLQEGCQGLYDLPQAWR